MIGAREIFKALEEAGVEYVVIGGLAQTLHGLAIRTDDLDICPARTTENLERLAHALRELDARKWDPHKGEAIDREWTPELLAVDRLWILHTKHGPLDVLFAPAGSAGYEELSKEAVVKEVAGDEVPVASIDSIIAMKEASGRPQDREHLSMLYRLKRLSEE